MCVQLTAVAGEVTALHHSVAEGVQSGALVPERDALPRPRIILTPGPVPVRAFLELREPRVSDRIGPLLRRRRRTPRPASIRVPHRPTLGRAPPLSPCAATRRAAEAPVRCPADRATHSRASPRSAPPPGRSGPTPSTTDPWRAPAPGSPGPAAGSRTFSKTPPCAASSESTAPTRRAPAGPERTDAPTPTDAHCGGRDAGPGRRCFVQETGPSFCESDKNGKVFQVISEMNVFTS